MTQNVSSAPDAELRRPCRECGRPHEARIKDKRTGQVTWADEDGHYYRPKSWEELTREFLDATEFVSATLKYLSREQIAEVDPAATAILDCQCGSVQELLTLRESFGV